MERKQILKAKVERIAKEAKPEEVAFLATLLTAGGRARYEYGSLRVFTYYRERYGDIAFEEIKRNLEDGGIVVDTKESLTLNYEPVEELEEVAKELSFGLFSHGVSFFSPKLKELLSESEGRYAVGELVKGKASEESIGHVRRVIGSKHWDEVFKKLTEMGGLVWLYSSKKHDYYALFEPLCWAVDLPEELRSALAWIYIAQGIRSEGVLRRDVVRHLGEKPLATLEAFGHIVPNYWQALRTFDLLVTTHLGSSIGEEVLCERLQRCDKTLAPVLSETPKRMIMYLIELLSLGSFHLEVMPKNGWDDVGSQEPEGGHLCLLRDPRIRDFRDIVLGRLVDVGLAVKGVNYYVSTKGGEIRDSLYVIASEARDAVASFFGDQAYEPLFDEELERTHRLFHFFDGLYAPYMPSVSMEYLEGRSDSYLGVDDLLDGLKKLAGRGVVTFDSSAGEYKLRTDRKKYRWAVRTLFLEPLVQHVLAAEERITRPEIKVAKEQPQSVQLLTKCPAVEAPTEDSGEILLGDLASPDELRSVIAGPLSEDEKREVLKAEAEFHLPMRSFAMHTCLFGTTNSGKSTTVKRLVSELASRNIPVMVVDWHSEYKDIIKELGGTILVPPTGKVQPSGDEKPLHWNVLDPRFYSEQLNEAILMDYTGLVVDLLAEKSVMEGLSEPMKSGLSRMLRFAYDEKDTLTTRIPPTIRDLLQYLDEVEMPSGTRDALIRRLERFRGTLGMIFCEQTSFDPNELFSTPTCIAVKHLTDEFPSVVSLLTYFVLRQVVSHFKNQGEVSHDSPVRHITVIDEAPRVFEAHAKAAGYVEKILEEMRKYGEGLILVARYPGISDIVLRETNQKISHRVKEDKDVNRIARLLEIEKDDKRLLSNLPSGIAFIKTGTDPVRLVRVKKPVISTGNR